MLKKGGLGVLPVAAVSALILRQWAFDICHDSLEGRVAHDKAKKQISSLR
jgi:hypothetical protein